MPIDDEWERMQIAQRIVDYLFVNGQGEEAERLVLTSCDNKNLGGWAKRPVVDAIVRELAKETTK
jgi:hypothetical protein